MVIIYEKNTATVTDTKVKSRFLCSFPHIRLSAKKSLILLYENQKLIITFVGKEEKGI